MGFELPELPYAYGALEPHIDARTMEIHHGKHHGGYVKKLNAALAEHEELQNHSLTDLLAGLSELPEEVREAVRNNGGGHFNHLMFWSSMIPGGGDEPEGKLEEALRRGFGSVDRFREQFTAAALGRFGSGWAWLGVRDGELMVLSTSNQDNPLMEGITPVLGLDVWEHAYYLKYQNRRADYVKAWWQLVNWNEVARNFGRST